MHGVTGSGKTEIYIKLANETIKNKKSAITKAKSKVSDALDIPVQFANKISLTNPKILLIKYAKEIIDIGPINFL